MAAYIRRHLETAYRVVEAARGDLGLRLATEEREGVTYYCYRRYVLPFEARRGWDETNKTRHVRVRR